MDLSYTTLLIQSFYQEGRPEDAKKLMEECLNKGCTVNVLSCAAVTVHARTVSQQILSTMHSEFDPVNSDLYGCEIRIMNFKAIQDEVKSVQQLSTNDYADSLSEAGSSIRMIMQSLNNSVDTKLLIRSYRTLPLLI
ncbi:hypothetical protein L6452_32755 [Arctium lappa]|uniref:Uncharacterized protein n=1 Tax=Arctium lappa TaxID=4217 RepID=A0ACB8Z5E2_ARCLA|nr:hypothetical protein L6452_32755 [Arctium lappa]